MSTVPTREAAVVADATREPRTDPLTPEEQARLVELSREAVERDLAELRRASNGAALLDRIDAAITTDLAYLALDPPTTAQAVAQVGRLTRQVVSLLRLVGNRLDDTQGT